jgi:hypothetical protein
VSPQASSDMSVEDTSRKSPAFLAGADGATAPETLRH